MYKIAFSTPTQEISNMTLDHEITPRNDVDEYNDACLKATSRALHYGSLTRPRTTLADLIGLASNDNNPVKGE